MIQIPEAAVEAAAKSILEYQRPNRPWDGWAPAGKDMWREVASAALEAAAPHMLAELRSHVADQILAANNAEGFTGLSAGLVAALKNLADRIPE